MRARAAAPVHPTTSISGHPATRPRCSVSGPARAFVSGRHLSRQPFNSSDGGCCFVAIIKLWKTHRRFGEIHRKIADAFRQLRARIINDTLPPPFWLRRVSDRYTPAHPIASTTLISSHHHHHHHHRIPTISGVSFTTDATLLSLVCQRTFLRFTTPPIDTHTATFFVVFKTTDIILWADRRVVILVI